MKHIAYIWCFFIIDSNLAEAYVYRGRPNCPLYATQNTWVDYLLGKYGDKTASLSVRFEFTGVIGPFISNTCYTVSYENGKWYTQGPGDTSAPTGLGGADPRQFNEFGQVLDNDVPGAVIGTLKCGIGPDC